MNTLLFFTGSHPIKLELVCGAVVDRPAAQYGVGPARPLRGPRTGKRAAGVLVHRARAGDAPAPRVPHRQRQLHRAGLREDVRGLRQADGAVRLEAPHRPAAERALVAGDEGGGGLPPPPLPPP